MVFCADRLKVLRKESGYRQVNIADTLGIRRETYCKYETGDILPPADMIQSLAKLFSVTADYLLDLTDNPRRPEDDYTPTIAYLFAHLNNRYAVKPELNEEVSSMVLI